MTNTTKKKIISFSLIIFGILVLITGIMMVQTGFATFDGDEPRVGLYIGGIFTIVGGSLLIIAAIIIFFFDDLKKKYIRGLSKIADAVEEERKKEKQTEADTVN
ncbi:MAG: hypothetical protein ACPG9E_05745 [Poseidonia sp.]